MNVIALTILLTSCSSDPPALNEPPTSSIPEIVLDTIHNSDDFLVLASSNIHVQEISEEQYENDTTLNTFGWFPDVFLATTDELPDSITWHRKYSPTIGFEDFRCEVWEGPLAKPDFARTPDAKRYITRITNGCKELGINFAGHFTLITWGCGSPCQGGAVVDRKTGEIFWGYSSSLGSTFFPDSKLIVLNTYAVDSTNMTIDFCAYCEIFFQAWNGREFEVIENEP